MRLIAYTLQGPLSPLAPLSFRRGWMDETPNRMAYRCLPMVIANQYGWGITTEHQVTVTWNGGKSRQSVHIATDGPIVYSQFGMGTFTFRIPYLFRTEPGWDLWFRGPINEPKDGAQSLEGIVETDWAVAPAFHSWMMTRRDEPVIFHPGDTICTVHPVQRGMMDSVEPVYEPLLKAGSVSPLKTEYLTFSESRRRFNADPMRGSDWQKHYFQGKTVTNKKAADHRTRLNVKGFEEIDVSRVE